MPRGLHRDQSTPFLSPDTNTLEVHSAPAPSSPSPSLVQARPSSPHIHIPTTSERLLRDALRRDRVSPIATLLPPHCDCDDWSWMSLARPHPSRAQPSSTTIHRSQSPSPESYTAPPFHRAITSPVPRQSDLHGIAIPRPQSPGRRTPPSSFSPRQTMQHPRSSTESVLRSRLENTLHRACSSPRTATRSSLEYRHDDRRSLESDSLSTKSRNGSTEFNWGPSERPHSPSPITATSPLTPPPSPPFNATAASELCRKIPGLVSFNDVEGLGCPPGADCDDGSDDDDDATRPWTWLWPTGWKRGLVHRP
ncbi:hypothetical protein SISSUDRAFT_1057567 [Sistotremastrum suecicum HHB10207 ss-3]|uniref:Uncharacterized protein n=1 Tax=Sistotremastrum suecicum HHB10207 ss-3 TaxID=1314776 RepID=A0A166IAG9_9AGAM|nr:hypothetical protein SISSUDRAFT_1057567 [Sistotremastrum suecicum HHB10207 ss-3]